MLLASPADATVYHDEILNDLRRPPRRRLFRAADQAEAEDKKASKGHYAIPHGGLFRYVSFPNYLCEWYVVTPQTPSLAIPHTSPSYQIALGSLRPRPQARVVRIRFRCWTALHPYPGIILATPVWKARPCSRRTRVVAYQAPLAWMDVRPR